MHVSKKNTKHTKNAGVKEKYKNAQSQYSCSYCLTGVQTGVLDMVGYSFTKENLTPLTQIDIVLDEYATSDEKAGIKRKIQGVVIHPLFDEETLKNDLAVVTLRSPISLSSGRVTPI